MKSAKSIYLQLLIIASLFNTITRASEIFDLYEPLINKNTAYINIKNECPNLSDYYAIFDTRSRYGNPPVLQIGNRTSATSPVFGFKHGIAVVCENKNNNKQLIIANTKNKIVYKREFKSFEAVDDRMNSMGIQLNDLSQDHSVRTYVRFQNKKLFVFTFSSIVKSASDQGIKRTKERVEIEQITFEEGILRKRNLTEFYMELDRQHFKKETSNYITLGGDLITWHTKYEAYIRNIVTNETLIIDRTSELANTVLSNKNNHIWIKEVGATKLISSTTNYSIYFRNGKQYFTEGLLYLDGYENLFKCDEDKSICTVYNHDGTTVETDMVTSNIARNGALFYHYEIGETTYYDVFGNLIKKYEGHNPVFTQEPSPHVIQVWLFRYDL
ncbi:hypothetical protein M902_0762 [Bacteriovorax sp. BAL6_X]|uniref:hypothetical protein n=1 Tax=Bacteriovorax sp. BAL6_X TaxID=1201290 RepID=UPI000385DF7D|nr:hypothetical protein [Bacteriovorax sp. BAL6_X]EPZ49211.1 hypothetical protein M902_0762 [Bacteriovorax sp. BAL6_X]